MTDLPRQSESPLGGVEDNATTKNVSGRVTRGQMTSAWEK